jgi:hypothetical protein
MNKSNAENVRIKRDDFAHLKGPGRQSEASIDAVAKSLSRFESYTRNKDFKTFRRDQAIGFTAYLSRERTAEQGDAAFDFECAQGVLHLVVSAAWVQIEVHLRGCGVFRAFTEGYGHCEDHTGTAGSVH